MPRVVTPQDRELADVLRKNLIPAYMQDLVRKGYDSGSARRLAVRRFENELRSGALMTASQDELLAENARKKSVGERLRNLRTSLALKLLAPKGGGR